METNKEVEFIRENQPDICDWQRSDREAVDRIAKEFDGLLSAEQLEQMRCLPSEFKSREDFELAHLERYGVRPKSGVQGFSEYLKDSSKTEASEKAAQICIEHPEIVNQTDQHERLHQASNPNAAKSIGKKGMEGVTQALTDRLTGVNTEKNVTYLNEKGKEHQFYPKETQMAKDLIAETGPRAVEKLYVQNDASELKNALGGDAQYEARMEQFKKMDEAGL